MQNITFKKNSENAKAVAYDVIDKVRKGQKIVLGKIIRSHGYSVSISRKPNKVTDTASYREVIVTEKELMARQLKIILESMSEKMKEASLIDLAFTFDKLQSAIFLLESHAPSPIQERVLREEDRKRLSKLLESNRRLTSP
jgi:DNA repair photolyase